MRNLKYALHSVAALAVASLTACSNDDGMEVNPSGIQKTVTLTAWQPGSESQTRVGFDSKGKAYWQEGDAIGVWSNGENKFNSFAIASEVGTGKASFSGTVTDGAGQYAVYPYSTMHRLANNTLYYYLPDTYVYNSVDQTFFPEEKDGRSFGMPMVGAVTNNVVKFKYLGGVICLLIDAMPAKSGTVTVTDSANQLCGRISASLTSNATPELKTKASTSNNTVKFEYSNATKKAQGVFFLPVATGTYNLTVIVEGENKTSTVTLNEVEITRTMLQALKVLTGFENGKSPAPVVINGHKFVDLGLPSGLLWAETNIGAETAADDGDYFAWGETKAKNSYSWSTYSWGTSDSDIFKYNDTDSLTTLESTDDAATVNWGECCRTPTASELEELNNSDNCTWTWTSKAKSNGTTIEGYEVRSNKYDNSIFLPASGGRYGDEPRWKGEEGRYWSSTRIVYRGGAQATDISAGHHGFIPRRERYLGYSIRPVAEPQK